MGEAEETERRAGMPGWVKVFVVIGVVLLVLLIAGLVFGGGEHGPGRHMGGGAGDETPTSHVPPVQHSP